MMSNDVNTSEHKKLIIKQTLIHATDGGDLLSSHLLESFQWVIFLAIYLSQIITEFLDYCCELINVFQKTKVSQPVGFEPARGYPIGFQVQVSGNVPIG